MGRKPLISAPECFIESTEEEKGMMKSYTDIEFTIDNGVARIVLNRPDKLNAIRIKTYRELIEAFRDADDSASCKVILLEGAGNTFTAGNDLEDLLDGDPREVMECVQTIFEVVSGVQKVVVAAIEGVAVGIGTTILLHCDMAFAASNVRFRLPFANIGVCPEGGSSVFLPQAIGQKAARELLLTGRFFSAEEAEKWGLINALTEPGEASSRASQSIELLLQQPVGSLLVTKKLMGGSHASVEKIVAAELVQFQELLQSEATRARLNKLVGR